ncbi:MAG: cache domain-containing protein [Candidatus Moranbacteria bacterium]|nr:cache domain-containing protein [Candidatus Moranbacteria bacterium]
MSKTLVFFIAFALVSFVVMISLSFFYVSSTEESVLKENQFKYLKGVVDSKSNRIDAFLNTQIADALFLADSYEIQDSFDSELISDTAQVTEMVKKVAKETSKEVEKYMKENPSATVQDMVNNPEFRKIATRRVGETGYTVFHGPDTIINYLHWDPEEQGDDHSDVFERDPKGQQAQLLLAAKNNTEDVSGFYTKKQSDGTLKEKFMYMSMLPQRSADGIRLAVQATVYLDDFGKTLKIAKDLDEEFRNFKNSKEYSDMFLINADGDIVWTAEKRNDLGSNLNRGVYKNTQLAKAYLEVKDNLVTTISDPGYYEASNEISIFVATPVFENKDSQNPEFKGVVALQISNEKMNNIVTDVIGSNGTGEVYAVNKGGIHITSVKSDIAKHSADELGHVVKSSQIDKCFEGLRYGEKNAVLSLSDFKKYDNYAGNPVYGVYQYVVNPGWCVLAEVNAADVENGDLFALSKKMIINIFLTVLVISISLGLIIDKFFLKKKIEEKTI